MGKRGEWYVVFQFLLILLVIAGPNGPSLFSSVFWGWAAMVFLFLGAFFFFSGVYFLGKNLTPLPHPRENSELVQQGPYALVRHPIYCGVILIGFAWAFWTQGLFTFVYALILFFFFDVKSRREERWLKAKFSEYTQYQKKVKKLIPYIY